MVRRANVFTDEIGAAIGAHGKWKVRLADAIEAGTFDLTVEQVKADNLCAFGKWLHGAEIPAGEKLADSYKTVLRLHAEFHREAANVLGLALAHEKEQALKALAPDSPYGHASAALTRAMMAWRQRAAA